MTHSREERELERFALMLRQKIQSAIQKVSQVRPRDVFGKRMTSLRRTQLFIEMFLITLFRAAISLFPAKSINRAPTRECRNPAE